MGPTQCEKCESAIFRISLSGGPTTYLPHPVTLAFRASRILLTVGIDISVHYSFQSYKVMSTVGVDILVNCSFQNYQILENFKSWNFCNFKRYQNSWKTLCFPSTIGIENVAFQSYQNSVNSKIWHSNWL